MLQSMGLQRVGHDRATELNCMVKNSNSEKQEGSVLPVHYQYLNMCLPHLIIEFENSKTRKKGKRKEIIN